MIGTGNGLNWLEPFFMIFDGEILFWSGLKETQKFSVKNSSPFECKRVLNPTLSSIKPSQSLIGYTVSTSLTLLEKK